MHDDHTIPAPLTDRERTAWHEAGHVAAALMLGIGVRRVSIIPDETSEGRVRVRHPRWWRTLSYESLTPHREGVVIRHAIMTLAGPVAEARVTGEESWLGASGDCNSVAGVNDILEWLGAADQAGYEAGYAWLVYRAQQLLALPEVWGRVRALAAALLARDELGADDIAGIWQEEEIR